MNVKNRVAYDIDISMDIINLIREFNGKKIKIMEVCGTHTVAIFRSGIRSVLAKSVELFSGPGCPICVTTQNEIDIFVNLAKRREVVIATFGDLMRVPGSFSSLQQEAAGGSDIRIIHSTFDAIQIAKDNPNKKIVFLGVGFETTAPTVAAAILRALKLKINNFYVFSAHKIVPPALEALVSDDRVDMNGFILPGHVSAIIGLEAYRPFFGKHKIPCVVAGFETIDILGAILFLMKQIYGNFSQLMNSYGRVVTPEGNVRAMFLLNKVFETVDSEWRGIGIIPKSGLVLREEYQNFDAQEHFRIDNVSNDDYNSNGCGCGEILMGIKTPLECDLYGKICTPISPVGPCMVSSEGVCAAYYRFNGTKSI